jgi:DNA-binding transcriptional MerR regulator
VNAFPEPLERRPAKSAAAFRTISEVASDLDVPQHVLRFWETKFTQVRPLKRGGGRRYYRPEDVDLLRRIRKLLYADGYTIKGVQKLLREGTGRPVVARELGVAPVPVEAAKPVVDTAPPPVPAPEPDRRKAELESILSDLESARALLKDA